MIHRLLAPSGSDYLELPIGFLLCMGFPTFIGWLGWVLP